MVCKINPKYSERTIYWQLSKLQDMGIKKKPLYVECFT